MYSARCVVVGDEKVGKTALLYTFTTNSFPGPYTPSFFSGYNANVVIDEKSVNLVLFDTSGSEEYDRLRPLIYPQADVLLMCFSVDNPNSFNNITTRWVPEVRHHCPNTPVILCGTKIDLRKDRDTLTKLLEKGMKPITFQEGCQKAIEIGAHSYVEISALNLVGLKSCIEEAMRAAIEEPSKKKNKSCNIQ